MQTVRFGLVGYGAWGKFHARAIRETAGCELRAIGCGTDVSVQAANSEAGAFVSTDFHEVVARPDIDVVDIVVPNYLHESVACAALEAGKHVLLEKPMSVSVESCDRIIRAAQRSGRLLLIGHEMRFSGMYARIHELIENGSLGEPRYVIFDLWRRPYRPGSGGWRLDPKRVGNWTLEEPVHFFDAVGWYLSGAGEPASVYAYGNRSDPSLPYVADISDNFTSIVS
ncbi:MAG: Gfo/Idh/MocA family protein, partial [Bryobacteraceae bacterium]